MQTRTDGIANVAKELSKGEKFLLMTHENPDGDAIGSLSALHRLLSDRGGDSLMFIAEADDPAPEYSFLVDWESVVREEPPDSAERMLVILDCGNAERRAGKDIPFDGKEVVNIDHHHDNTAFGTSNLVIPEASCTAEIVWNIAGALGLEISRDTAEALYVGLVTDTGRFMYASAGQASHVMAADLIGRGVDVQDVFRRIYEGVPAGRVEFLARALGSIERFDDGELALVWLSRNDFEAVGAPDGWSEGIIDYLRSIEGTKVAAVVREPSAHPDRKRISLRSSSDAIDVSRIAREGGGGGHMLAAGFSSELPREELIDFIRSGLAAQREPDRPSG